MIEKDYDFIHFKFENDHNYIDTEESLREIKKNDQDCNCFYAAKRNSGG